MRYSMLVAAAVVAAALPPGGPGVLPAEAKPVGKFRVRATFPAADSPSVLTDPVAVQFSVPVDPASLVPAAVRFRAPAASVPGTVTVEGDPRGRRMVFRPAAPLAPATAYTLILTTAVRSLSGAPLDEEFRMSFATAPLKPPAVPAPLPERYRLRRVPRLGPPPRVVWTQPLMGLTSVFNDVVTLRFSRPLAAATVNESSFHLLFGNQSMGRVVQEVPGSGAREFQIIPHQPLFRASSYAVVVTRDVRSDRGRPLREEFRGGFTTSPMKDGVRPLLPDAFTAGPLLFYGRAFHTAHRLEDGRVVVAGGQDLDGTPIAATEVLPAAGGHFVPGPLLGQARTHHAAVVLRDGRLLVTGGYAETRATLSTCEAFSPTTGEWEPVPTMRVGRAHHTATLLANGRVLVAGGFTRVDGVLQYATGTEIFDPLLNVWSDGPPLATPRGGHTATLLADGRVLLVGGARFGEASAEVFHPTTLTSTRTAGNPGSNRTFHAATVTKSGGVLLAGGGPVDAEHFAPTTGNFLPAGPVPVEGLTVVESPYYLSLTAITEGRVVLLGGLSAGGGTGGTDLILSQVLLWDPSGSGGRGAFYRMPFTLPGPRAGHSVTPLADGSYLIAGGLGTGAYNERSTLYMRP